MVERFVQARKLIKEDPSETVQICTQLLSSQNRIDNAIRIGDVFALLIEYYYKINDYQKAFGECVEEEEEEEEEEGKEEKEEIKKKNLDVEFFFETFCCCCCW